MLQAVANISAGVFQTLDLARHQTAFIQKENV